MRSAGVDTGIKPMTCYWRADYRGPARRVYWFATDLETPESGPLWRALLAYRQYRSRWSTPRDTANLVSSKTQRPRVHLPIIDLDIPHEYSPSSTPGRAHLYLDEAIPRWRWLLLMIGLRQGRVIDKGFFWWSLRRGANFVRLPGIKKLTNTKRAKSARSRLQE